MECYSGLAQQRYITLERLRLDFTFPELNVLTNNWVVFANHQLLSDVPGILLGNIVESSIRSRIQADFDVVWLGHSRTLKIGKIAKLPNLGWIAS